MSILQIKIKEAGYGKKIILNDINIDIEKGKVSAFIGPNGAGKSTLLKAVMGLLEDSKGKIIFNDTDLLQSRTDEIVKAGISFVPQGNRVFTDLTVKENLEVGGYLLKDKNVLKENFEAVLSYFPDLLDRLKIDAGDLSGGEKQQCALARALMLKPKVLLLDEPSLGLSPQLVKQAFDTIKKINEELGTTILIVEQKVREVLKISDLVYALRLGRIAFEGTPAELDDENLKKIFLI